MNQFDALIIGGGNYFELWVESSPTGTSIAIPPDLFSKIKIPIFFNALGVDPGQGVPDSSRIKFMGFLDTLLGSEQYLVSVRNDGAKKNLSRHVGNRYSEAVLHTPDNGFFVEDMNLEENIDEIIKILSQYFNPTERTTLNRMRKKMCQSIRSFRPALSRLVVCHASKVVPCVIASETKQSQEVV